MHQCAHPDLDPVASTKLLLPHQSMKASIPVIDIATRDMPAQMIFFDPVQLEVAKGFTVPAADDGEAMFVIQGACEKHLLRGGGPGDAPEGGDAWLIHPVVQEVGVAGVKIDVANGW